MALSLLLRACSYLYWIGVLIFVILLSVVTYYPSALPRSLVEIVQGLGSFGKLTPTAPRSSIAISFLLSYRIPKSWFTYFYLTGSIWHIILSIFIWVSSPTSSALLLVLLLFTVHCTRRLHESRYVSVYHPTSTMNSITFIISIFYYIMIGFTIIFSVPFERRTSIFDGFFAIVFLFINYLQHHHCVLMANLRSGTNVHKSSGYNIPDGSLFELVSCPHYLLEILLYISLNIIVGPAPQFILCSLSVTSNQILLGHMVHRWYIDNMPNYPSKRRAIIPYVL
uniref:3-oxo-5-alpha-steroid 4-dehydrogenase C-terminal domain-containing protein n=1 Tax=Spongospora subterranea TaxID=70186 RepID=A0A0H5QKN1_9EUKA|eukprot:CRZ02695.1 hypothetical protein [Spongospora subterranea]